MKILIKMGPNKSAAVAINNRVNAKKMIFYAELYSETDVYVPKNAQFSFFVSPSSTARSSCCLSYIS